jgi:ATP/maltotriose-dependent transcriptional regulator MalT
MALSSLDDWVTVGQVYMGRAFVASGRGEHELACDLARQAAELMDAHEYVTLQQAFLLSYAEILIAAGRPDHARAELLRGRAVAERKGSTVVVAKADSLLAGVAQ